MIYYISVPIKLDSLWLKLYILSNIFPKNIYIDTHIIIQVFQSCIDLWFPYRSALWDSFSPYHNSVLSVYLLIVCNFCKRNIMISHSAHLKDLKSTRLNLNVAFYLRTRDKSDGVFSRQKKSKCVSECCDVGILYSWKLGSLGSKLSVPTKYHY